MSRVLVLGLDGATFEVLEPLARRGQIPFLQQMRAGGTSGDLLSVMPPATAPAWVSFMTGKNPGNHGIFDFLEVSGSMVFRTPRRPLSSLSIPCPTLWSILGQSGKKVGLINIPMTYPATEVNGFLISGMLAPSLQSNFIYPRNLYTELYPLLGEYLLDIPLERFAPGQEEELVHELARYVRQRARYARHLLQHTDWDFFMVVFTETDRLQHKFWHRIDAGLLRETGRNTPWANLLGDFYRTLDEELEQIVRLAGDDCTVLVMSDHGFGEFRRVFHANRWLELNGFLRFHALRRGLQGFLKRGIGSGMPAGKSGEIEPGGRGNPGAPSMARRIASGILDPVDWRRTKAYFVARTLQGIYLNVKGRQPQGCIRPGPEYEETREEIISRLRELHDPETGESLSGPVFRNEEVLQGPYAQEMPDIIFFPDHYRQMSSEVFSDKLLQATDWKTGTGNHRPNGVVLAEGPNVLKGKVIEGARIIDLAPTILHLLGVPVPCELDGRVLEEMLTDGFRTRHPMRRTAGETEGGRSGSGGVVYSVEETTQIEEHLRGIGYLE